MSRIGQHYVDAAGEPKKGLGMEFCVVSQDIADKKYSLHRGQ